MQPYNQHKKITRVLVNSVPKSGTHLLAKAIELYGFREHFAGQAINEPRRITPLFLNYREVQNAMAQQTAERRQNADIPIGGIGIAWADSGTLREWLDALPEGTYIMGHIGWSPGFSAVLEKSQVRQIVIIRDPRAVLVSLMDFVLDTRGMPKPHFLAADFRVMSLAERLELLLEGGEAPRSGLQVRPFAALFRSISDWNQDASCLMVRFEDLVGTQGGGSELAQRDALERIKSHLLGSSAPSFDDEDTPPEIYGSQTRTLRQGAIHGWTKELTPALRSRIHEYCLPLCELAGYHHHD